MIFVLSELIGNLKNGLVALRHMLKSPLDRLLEKQQLLDELCSGLNQNIRYYLDISRQRMVALIEKLEALSPLAVLSRGYSLSLLLPVGEIIKEAAQIKPGDNVKTILAKGAFIGSVEEVIEDESSFS
jgi:exodeoxyribonuclease VII large subunit